MAEQKRSKAKKMAWADFVKDEEFGSSWADEDVDLPSAPASVVYGSREATRPIGYGGGESHGDRGVPMRGGYHSDRGGYRPNRNFGPREPSRPIPDEPPFVAFVGQLAPETNESHLRDIFDDLGIVSIRFVTPYGGSGHKGFCYMELESPGALAEALNRHGTPLLGKYIKVDVAEPQNSYRSDRQFSRQENQTHNFESWRKYTPDSSEGGDAPYGDASPTPRFALGANFTPSAKSKEADRPRFNLAPRSQSAATAPTPVARAEPAKPVAASSKPNPFGNAKPVDVRDREKDIEEKLAKQREKLLGDAPEKAPAPAPTKPKSNPFGNAKPVDVRDREKEIEEKLNKKIESLRVSADEASKTEAKETNPGGDDDAPKSVQSRVASGKLGVKRSSHPSDRSTGEGKPRSASKDRVYVPRSERPTNGVKATDGSSSRPQSGNSRRRDVTSRGRGGAVSSESASERRGSDRKFAKGEGSSSWTKAKGSRGNGDVKGPEKEEKSETVVSKNKFDMLDIQD